MNIKHILFFALVTLLCSCGQEESREDHRTKSMQPMSAPHLTEKECAELAAIDPDQYQLSCVDSIDIAEPVEPVIESVAKKEEENDEAEAVAETEEPEEIEDPFDFGGDCPPCGMG